MRSVAYTYIEWVYHGHYYLLKTFRKQKYIYFSFFFRDARSLLKAYYNQPISHKVLYFDEASNELHSILFYLRKKSKESNKAICLKRHK